MVWPTMQTVARLNYMPEESKKAEKSTTLVDLLAVDVIWIDQRSEVDSENRSQLSCDHKTCLYQKSGSSTVS